jgi:FAD/FMN-containing dehydrogenase
MIAWPVERALEVMAAYAALMAVAPDDLCGGLALLDAPPAPFIPRALHGEPIVAVLALWTGGQADAEGLLRPLRDLLPAFDGVAPVPYAALQGMFERPPEVQVPTRSHGEGGFLGELPPEALAAIVGAAAGRPSELGSILLQPLGGAFARVPEEATPLGRRDAAWHYQLGTAWVDPADDEPSRAWIDHARRALEPWRSGESYPNFIPDPDPARLRASYSAAVWERLRAVRAEWDPEGVFGAGHSIPLS